MLKNRQVLLGVCGGIAAYKAAELLRLLQKQGASVRVMMTQAARRFVTPLTFQALSGHPVACELFEPSADSRIGHISLARDIDCLLVAPATANFLAKIACGLADDLPSTVVLASTGPLVLAPAMNLCMWENPVTRENLGRLEARPRVSVVPPDTGELACGESGSGRLARLEHIVEAVARAIGPRDLTGWRILVSSGPTREHLDPVRFLSNRSSGRMGHALARVAQRRGAVVTLVRGPVDLEDPPGVKVLRVETARQMHEAIAAQAGKADALIMAAAVSDLRAQVHQGRKLRKDELLCNPCSWEQNQDILADMGARGAPRVRVGFAAETEAGLDAARAKLQAKACHLLALNRVDLPGEGFEAETNRVILLDRSGSCEEIPLAPKEEVASRILDRVATLLENQGRPDDAARPLPPMETSAHELREGALPDPGGSNEQCS